jgi:hypothetical protein
MPKILCGRDFSHRYSGAVFATDIFSGPDDRFKCLTVTPLNYIRSPLGGDRANQVTAQDGKRYIPID